MQEADWKKNLLETSSKIYLTKPRSIVAVFNRINTLSSLKIPSQDIEQIENLTEDLKNVLDMKNEIDENFLEHLKSGQCEKTIDSLAQMNSILWIAQTALLGSSLIYMQNRWICLKSDRVLRLACNSSLTPSFQILLGMLKNGKSWTFHNQICFEIELDQLYSCNENISAVIESVVGYKTNGHSLTQLMCLIMSSISIENDKHQEPQNIGLALIDVPLYCRLSRLYQLHAIHWHLQLEYGDTSNKLKKRSDLTDQLEHSARRFSIVIDGLHKTCLKIKENRKPFSTKETVDIIYSFTQNCKEHQEKNMSYTFDSKLSGMERLLMFAEKSTHEGIIHDCQPFCPETIMQLLKKCFCDIVDHISIRCKDDKEVLSGILDIYTGLLVFHMSSNIGRVDIAEILRYTADLIDYNVHYTATDIIAYDACKTLLMPSFLRCRTEENANIVHKGSIKQLVKSHPAHDEKRALLSDNMKKSDAISESLVSEIPTRHPNESFRKLSQEIEQFTMSHLMEINFIKEIQSQLLYDFSSDRMSEGIRYETLMDKIQTWKDSVTKFTRDFKAKYSSYEEVTAPLLWGICNTAKGIKILLERFQKRCYQKYRPNVINDIVVLRDKATKLLYSSCTYEHNLEILPIDRVCQLEASRLLYYSQQIQQEETGEQESDGDRIIYRFNCDSNEAEDAFENDSECQLKIMTDQTDLNYHLQITLDPDHKMQSLQGCNFLEHYNGLMTNLRTTIDTANILSNNHNSENILYSLHCRALFESIKVLSDIKISNKSDRYTSTDCRQEIKANQIRLCNNLEYLRKFITEEICPFNPREENSFVKDMLEGIENMLSRSVQELAIKQNSFLVPIENLISTSLEWNRNAARNQIVPIKDAMDIVMSIRKDLCCWTTLVKECDTFLFNETHEVVLSALLPCLEMCISGFTEKNRHNEQAKSNQEKRKALCAPFILFFTSSFLGDFVLRLKLVEQLAMIFSTKDPISGGLINAIQSYFAVYQSNIEKVLVERKRNIKTKFEVMFRTSKLFIGEDKFTNHFKEATKFKRAQTIEYLKLLKEPALRYCNRVNPSETAIDATETKDEMSLPLPIEDLPSRIELALRKDFAIKKDFSDEFKKQNVELDELDIEQGFKSSKDKILAENEEQMSRKSLSIVSKSIADVADFEKSVCKKITASRALMAALSKELAEKKSVPCAFHPTQKAMQNICSEMKNEFGLRHQYGSRYQISASNLLMEISKPNQSLCADYIFDSIQYAILKYDEFSGIMLQPNRRDKSGDNRALPVCQKGIDILSHGMLNTLKLACSNRIGLFENIKVAADVCNQIQEILRLSTSSKSLPRPCDEIFEWSKQLVKYLSRQELHCKEIIETLNYISYGSNITAAENQDFKGNAAQNGLFFEAMKNSLSSEHNDWQTVKIRFSSYYDHIRSMKEESFLLFKSDINGVSKHLEILSSKCVLAHSIFEDIHKLLPIKGARVVSTLCNQQHYEIVNHMEVKSRAFALPRYAEPCDGVISKTFHAMVRSTAMKCLKAIEIVSRATKEMEGYSSISLSNSNIETKTHSLIHMVDLGLRILNALKLKQIYQELQIHKKYMNDSLNQPHSNIGPLIQIFANHYEIIAHAYLESLVQPTLRFVGNILDEFSLYFGDAASIFTAFLKYKFSKEQEDNQKQEGDKEGESKETQDGCGLGDADGDGSGEATTKDLESEDIFDTAQKPGEDNSEDKKPEDTKEEDGVEMSEGLEHSEMQNVEENTADESDESEGEENEEEKMDAEEDKTDQGNDLLDEDVWDEDQDDECKDSENDNAHEKSKENSKSNEVKDQTGVDAPDDDPNKVNDVEEDEKRKRKDDSTNENDEAEEIEMNDNIYMDEEMANEPEDMPDMEDDQSAALDNENDDSGSGDEQMEEELVDTKLPDFEQDDQNETELQEAEKPCDDLSQNEEQVAGVDRNNSNNANEAEDSQKNPEQSDRKDQKPNEKLKTTTDGLLDEDEGKSNSNAVGDENENNSDEDQNTEDVDIEGQEPDQDKFMESTDCAGVERLPISKTQTLKDESKNNPSTPKIFEHISEHQEDSIKTVDKIDESEKPKSKEKSTTNEENDIPMDNDDENVDDNVDMKLNFQDSDLVKTSWAKRGGQDMILSDANRTMELVEAFNGQAIATTLETYYRSECRTTENIEGHLSEWLTLCSQTRTLSASLTEQLRLILEPTRATKFKGDFRTGKRLNMRKIIPYIASGFRKDRIWLRRTKPSAREYQVIIAIDDSSSMCDNAVKYTTYKSLSTICQALSTLDVGKFGVLGFGNQAKMVQPLQSNFSAEDGAHLINTLTFEQTATNVAAMLAMARKAFTSCRTASSSSAIILEKLLIIISDGRNIFSEGEGTVREAIRSARLENIFIIFLIVENIEDSAQKTRDSILDIRHTSFDKAGMPTIVPYMEKFPFAQYVIIR